MHHHHDAHGHTLHRLGMGDGRVEGGDGALQHGVSISASRRFVKHFVG